MSAPGGARASIGAGRVGRPHGLDGSFYVTRPRARLLAQGASVTIAGESRRIVRRAGTEQRPIVQLEGIADRDAALALRGSELTVPGEDAPPLGEDEYWAHELVGCAVRSREGRAVGVVTRLIELPSCEALEVQPAGDRPVLLVPMVHDAIRSVDVSGRSIEVDADFLDLAGPAGAELADGGAGQDTGSAGGRRGGSA